MLLVLIFAVDLLLSVAVQMQPVNAWSAMYNIVNTRGDRRGDRSGDRTGDRSGDQLATNWRPAIAASIARIKHV